MNELSLISLFTGIGGLDFGFEAAGYKTRVAVEMDKYCCDTIRKNRPEWRVIEGDINNIESSSILERAGLEPGEADMLIGGPPCQPFSKSGYWMTGDSLRLDDPRADTLTAYLRVLRDVKPKAFLLENVYGIAYKDKDEGLKYLLNGIEQINKETGTNYSISWKLINTVEFGVPQIRERVFLIGSRDGMHFKFPEPTHFKPNDKNGEKSGLKRYVSTWDALFDLKDEHSDKSLKVGGKWGDLLPSIPEGQNYLWHTERGGGKPIFKWRSRYWSFLLKLAKELPSWTIQAQPGSAIGPFHWDNRKLTFQEMCRLQTFPDGLVMPFGRTEMQRMVGNAVPSLIAEILAREIRDQFLSSKNLDQLQLLPRSAPFYPMPNKIAHINEKYLALIEETSVVDM
ncbi:DNA cytosine methyltransferase [Aeromonas sp. QDB03]|uniref:DNA cytosine methyltransferase n=1 Tax=Aeromonas sp. QDB03 TaxID=2989839 RepID=UPI0022E1DE16|nr:DNA (cytosine-5-)-methyltransferase [Aeromonas sp. QDB03]